LLRILALVKYSLDASEIRVDSSTHQLRMAGVPERFGDVDKRVVEAAVRLKEAMGGTVQLLCLGPPAAKRVFREVLAMGADEAILVEDPFGGRADAAVAVRVLEAAIRACGPFDVILCGFASDDGYTYQTGPRLAERLGVPLVSYARELRLSDGALNADRDLGDRLQTVSVPLPVIASIAEEAFTPRRVTLLEAMKAQKKPMVVWQVHEELGLSREELELLSGYVLVSETGVVVPRKQRILKGSDLAELADQFIDALLEENVVKEGV
jgi:electron transfer flavoprotein beta subunit